MELRGPIGGAVVQKRFQAFGGWVERGQTLTAEQYASIPYANRTALQNKDFIRPFPAVAPEVVQVPQEPSPPESVMTIHRGGGKFDVVVGRIVTETPLAKAEAEALVEALSGSAAETTQ